jgi:hypothetical protein
MIVAMNGSQEEHQIQKLVQLANSGYGVCECQKLTKGLSSPINGFLDCTTGDETHPFITTKSNFGCVLWKLKGD